MRLAQGGSGGVAVCLGVGGLVDLENVLGLEVDENGEGGCDGVEMWVFDARRPWNLSNVFSGFAAQHGIEGNQQVARKQVGIEKGQISRTYRPGKGGIVIFDDGDIEAEMGAERDAWFALEEMPDVEDDDEALGESDDEREEDESEGARPDADDSAKRKRKSWSDRDEEDESEKENQRPHQRRRSNSVRLLHCASPRQAQNCYAVLRCSRNRCHPYGYTATADCAKSISVRPYGR